MPPSRSPSSRTPSAGAQFVTATATDPDGNTSEFQRISVATSTAHGQDRLHHSDGRARGSRSPSTAGVVKPDPAAVEPARYTWSFGDGATATGPAPFHVFTTVGSDIVSLTVSDGFGGTSQATATVVVQDIAPAFVPRSFSAPQSFACPHRATDSEAQSQPLTATSRLVLASITVLRPRITPLAVANPRTSSMGVWRTA